MRQRLLLIAVSAALLGGCGAGRPEPSRLGIYSESTDFAQVEATLPELAARGLDLYQVMEPSHLGSPALTSLLRACGRQGVGVRAWLVLPRAEGLWPNESNVDRFAPALDALLAWIADAQLPVGHVTFDMEPAWDYTQAILRLGGDVGNPDSFPALLALFRSHLDAARFTGSRQRFADLIERVHRAGLRAHAVTYPMVVDAPDVRDPAAGHLEDIFDIPVRGLDWDEVSLMVYRSTWQGFSAEPLSSDLLYQYGQSALAAFGARAGIDLGVVGRDPITGSPGYQDPQELAADVGAAKAAGIERLHLYSLETVRSLPLAAPFLDFATAPVAAPAQTPERAVSNFRGLFRTLDVIAAQP